jgi:TRAP-type C4-dicarboxylate transport system permease small subunit
VALLQSMDQRSDALDAPSWIPQSFVTIGLGMMAFMIAVKLVISLRR